MINELKKSISHIMYERITSPLYGTFVVSWLAWNWKIPYITLFVSEDNLSMSRIDYIMHLGLNQTTMFWYPAVSTALLIIVVPVVSTGAYWFSLTYENWKRNIKIGIEKNQLLTIAQSIEIREEIRNQENKYAQLTENKDKEISTLQATINVLQEKYNEEPIEVVNPVNPLVDRSKYPDEYRNASLNSVFKDNLNEIADAINNGRSFYGSGIPGDAISFFVGNELISKTSGSNYEFTDKGKYFLREYINGTTL